MMPHPVTELMFHGLADGTSLASFYGLCNKAGPVRKCILQNPTGSHGVQSSTFRSRRLFGLVDYVHPSSVQLAKVIFQQQSYRDMGILVSDAAISMSNRAPQSSDSVSNSGSISNFLDSRSFENGCSSRNQNSQEVGCEVGIYNLPANVTEENLRIFLHNKNLNPQKCYVVQPEVLINYARASSVPDGIVPVTTSAAILLFTEYMSAKVATFTDSAGWGYLQRRLVGIVYRDRNAASSLYWDMNCYFQVRMITKNGFMWGCTSQNENNAEKSVTAAAPSRVLQPSMVPQANNLTTRKYLGTHNTNIQHNQPPNFVRTDSISMLDSYGFSATASGESHAYFEKHINSNTLPVLSALQSYGRPNGVINGVDREMMPYQRSNSNFSLSSMKAESVHFSCSTRTASVTSVMSNDCFSYASGGGSPGKENSFEEGCTTIDGNISVPSYSGYTIDDMTNRQPASKLMLSRGINLPWRSFTGPVVTGEAKTTALPMVTMGVIEYLMDDPCW